MRVACFLLCLSCLLTTGALGQTRTYTITGTFTGGINGFEEAESDVTGEITITDNGPGDGQITAEGYMEWTLFLIPPTGAPPLQEPTRGEFTLVGTGTTTDGSVTWTSGTLRQTGNRTCIDQSLPDCGRPPFVEIEMFTRPPADEPPSDWTPDEPFDFDANGDFTSAWAPTPGLVSSAFDIVGVVQGGQPTATPEGPTATPGEPTNTPTPGPPTATPTMTNTPFTPGPCCEASTNPACNNAVCTSCVCQVDSFCCTELWDQSCVAIASADCSADCGCSVSSSCPGDCDGDGTVSISELIIAVNIALGSRPVEDCSAIDVNGDGNVSISELIQGVNAALGGCPS